MAEEILVNATPRETRVAVVESGVLQELHIERGWRRGVVGNIYRGKVQRVMPGMQAAFVEVGLERAAFLHAGDVVRPPPAVAEVVEGEAPLPTSQPPITELLRDGQDVVVQVVKDPIGSKGARLTTQISIPSRYLVLLPQSKVIGVSARIVDEDERARLKGIVSELSAANGGYGYIIRTNAEGQPAEAIADDFAYLTRVWNVVERRGREAPLTSMIYEDLALPLRAVRDLIRRDTEKVRVDTRQTYEQLQAFVAKYMPVLSERVELYDGERPIFDLYGVEDEIARALDKQVPLKSGGYLVIDQTEAMTTIDVNTGSFLGQRNLEETVYRTNLEAAQAAARQLRLRNLGGIIIIDFIDMEDEEHRRQVLRTLEKQLERDHAKTNIIGITELGLVQMTRKRTRESLVQVLCEPCPSCQGRGMLKTPETICYEIFREILREARAYQADSYLVLANQKVVDRLLDEESGNVADLELFIGRPIKFQVEAMYSQEQYDVVLL